MRRVRVKQAHPKITFDLLNVSKQRGESPPRTGIPRLPRPRFGLPQIHSVVRSVLTDQVDFAHTFADERTDFRQDRFRFAAPMLAAHLWNHAKTARMIAALGNLHVSGMRRSKSETRRVVIGNVPGPLVRKREIDRVIFRRNVECPAFLQNSFDNPAKLFDLIESDERVYLRQLVMQFSRKPLRHSPAYD